MKWEYRILEVGIDPKKIEKTMQEWGEAGWEVFHVQPGEMFRLTGPKFLLFLKRSVS